MKTRKQITIVMSLVIIMLSLNSSLFSQLTQSWELTNDWNTPTLHPYNSIVDSKPNPGDGIYTIEKDVVLVPYVQDGDTLYGYHDSDIYLKKFDFQGTNIWSVSFPTVLTFEGTVGEPRRIKILHDGIFLLCDWGIAKYTFDGTELFSTVYPQSSFDQNGFFGGGSNQNYCWNDVLQSNGSTITLGHIYQCESECTTSDYIFNWVSEAGVITDSLYINRNAEMCFVQQNGSVYFSYIENGAIMIERVDLQTKEVIPVINYPYAVFNVWDINELISIHKTTNGFRLISSNLKAWDWEYNSTHTPTNYFVEIDTIENSMTADSFVQNNTKLKPCLDEWTLSIQVGDTLYISTEDAKLIKWDYCHQINVFDLLEPQERIYGTARIALFGDKLLYVTNDSILTTIDSIVGNTTYTTEHKSAVIRVLDKDLNVVTQDTLAEYTISQFDLSAIDSTSFTFSAWSSDQSLLSSWSLIGHEMTEINEQKKPNEFDFTIYPNPTSDYINIIGVEEGSLIKIIDSSGRIVFDEFYHGTIDIHGFARGIYCIIIKDRVKKIIIQ